MWHHTIELYALEIVRVLSHHGIDGVLKLWVLGVLFEIPPFFALSTCGPVQKRKIAPFRTERSQTALKSTNFSSTQRNHSPGCLRVGVSVGGKEWMVSTQNSFTAAEQRVSFEKKGLIVNSRLELILCDWFIKKSSTITVVTKITTCTVRASTITWAVEERFAW